MKAVKNISLFILFLCVLSLNAQTWKNPNATIDERVDDLISKMTLDEKISYCPFE